MKETTTTMSTPVSDHRQQDREAIEGIEAARRVPKRRTVIKVEELDSLPMVWHRNGYIYSREDDRPVSLDARTLMMTDDEP